MPEIEVRVRLDGKPYLRARLKKSPATIGRDPEADVFLDSTAVSRLHARLFFDGKGVRIVDNGSTNGVKIDGVPHGKAEISPDHTVTICEFTIKARAVSAAAPLGDELSEGWLEMEELDDDTSVGAADTNVHRLQAIPSVTEPEEGRERSAVVRDTAVDINAEDEDDEEPENTPVPEAVVDEEADTSAEDPEEEEFITDDDEAEEADLDRVPDPEDVPPMLNVMRHAASELEREKNIAVEVLVSVGSRLHDVALVRPGKQYWWGREQPFPASLFAVPTHDHFPLVAIREAGTYDVQVPQDSTWKMFHRGAGKATTYRTGKLVGMRVIVGEQAEATYGPYNIYLRCVKAPPPLVAFFDPKRWLPSPAVAASFLIALFLNIIVVALPADQRMLFKTDAPAEHFVAFDNGEKPAPQPPPDLPVIPLDALPPPPPLELAVAKDVKKPEPGIPANEKHTDRPPIPVKQPKDTPPDPNAGVTTIEAAKTPKQMSIGDFRVAGLLQGVPEPMIQKNHGPPVSGGSAMLRGDKTNGPVAVMGRSNDPTIIPPGRIEAIDLQKTINAHQREAMQCYVQVGLRDNEHSAGKLELQWTVDESGQAKRVRVIVDELRSAPMTKCMTEAIGRWTFPTPTGGPAVVSYPFRFQNPNL